MSTSPTYRDVVRELALDNYGYVTTKGAAEAGVPAVELPKLVARGGLEHVAYGVYRVPDVAPTRFDQFAEALLRAGDGAYLHGESVLALFELADVNPWQIKVAVPRRARPKVPAYIELVQVKAGARTTLYEGLASQPVADALLECRGRVEPARLIAGAKEARERGLLTTAEWTRVTKELRP
jgi:predicted transcriptional regulator of viral defense system